MGAMYDDKTQNVKLQHARLVMLHEETNWVRAKVSLLHCKII